MHNYRLLKRKTINTESLKFYKKKIKKDRGNFFYLAGLAMEAGFVFVVPMVSGVFLGLYLDKKLNTQSRLTLVFLILGVLIGFFNFYRIINSIKD